MRIYQCIKEKWYRGERERVKVFNHLKTITYHKWLVCKGCFAVGLYRQGLLHDMSKYSPSEFWVGAKYFQGNRSPNNAEREAVGYSTAWLHHKGRNKHHYEYWIDYPTNKSEGLVGMEMPVRYVVEMFCDRVAASKNYNKEKYKDSDALDYFLKGRSHYVIHPRTEALLFKLLKMLAERGEEYTFAYIRKKVIKRHIF